MSVVIRNYEEWIVWMRKHIWTNPAYVPPDMNRPHGEDYPMICNTTYNRRQGDFTDVETVSLKDFTDENCPLPVSVGQRGDR